MEAIRPEVIGLVAMGLPISACDGDPALEELRPGPGAGDLDREDGRPAHFLGLVLEWVFSTDNPWVVLGVAAAMLLAASQAVGARQGRSTPGVKVEALCPSLSASPW